MIILTYALAFLAGMATGLFLRYLQDEADAILPGNPDDWWL